MACNVIWLMRAGVPGLHTHQLRHTYAVTSLREGMPERVLQIVGGWKRVPETYFRTLGLEDAKRYQAQVSPGDRLPSEHGRQRAPGAGRAKGKL